MRTLIICLLCLSFVLPLFASAQSPPCSLWNLTSFGSYHDVALYGSFVAWSSEGTVFVYDLGPDHVVSSDDRGTFIVIDNRTENEDLTLFNTTLAWISYAPDAKLSVCDLQLNGQKGGCLSSDSKWVLSLPRSLKIHPQLYNSLLVWQEHDGSDFEIRGCFLDNKCASVRWYTNNTVDDLFPRVGTFGVTWQTSSVPSALVLSDHFGRHTFSFPASSDQREPVWLSNHVLEYWGPRLGTDDVFAVRFIPSSGTFFSLNLTGPFADDWAPVHDVLSQGELRLWKTSGIDGVSYLVGQRYGRVFPLGNVFGGGSSEDDVALAGRSFVFLEERQTERRVVFGVCS